MDVLEEYANEQLRQALEAQKKDLAFLASLLNKE
jgi:hypothetical protein